MATQPALGERHAVRGEGGVAEEGERGGVRSLTLFGTARQNITIIIDTTTTTPLIVLQQVYCATYSMYTCVYLGRVGRHVGLAGTCVAPCMCPYTADIHNPPQLSHSIHVHVHCVLYTYIHVQYMYMHTSYIHVYTCTLYIHVHVCMNS